MKETSSQYRLAENEVIFREWNEQQQRNIDRLNAMADEDNQPEHRYVHRDDDEAALQFYCECSDENCKARLSIRHHDYNEIHKNRKRFVVKKGHDVVAIEKIVKQETKYMIVEKRVTPPAPSKTGLLNPTNLDHTS